jgi:hypothetical protein
MINRMMLIMTLLTGLTGSALIQQGVDEAAAMHPAPQGRKLDLAKPFHTRSAWRFVATEGPPTKDFGDGDAPGALTLCLHRGLGGPCVYDPVTLPLNAPTPDYAIAWEPHYLKKAKIVYPHGQDAALLLLLVTGSLYSGDGDQVVSTQLIAYDASKDIFHRIFGKSTGRNNNEEIRFVVDGPLQGSVISAEPQEHLPYGYWIVVDELTSAGEYRQVLRYRSATLYNDGNRLAVIDSEMPNIERRLGLWKPGGPIPVPSGKACSKPILRHTELWCD